MEDKKREHALMGSQKPALCIARVYVVISVPANECINIR